jgi:hypothetical protein
MERITMRVDGEAHLLAQNQDREVIAEAVVQADRDGAGIVTVTVTVVGNRTLDVVVTPGVPITFETETVPDDDRDDGDLEAPFEVPEFDVYFGEGRS